MWRAVGAEEELRIAAGRGFDERLAVALALEDRQAVKMRPQSAAEHGAAIEEKMLWRDRCGDTHPARAYELDAGASSHMLEHHAQPRMPPDEGSELPLDEDALAVIGIDVVAGHLAVNLQHDVSLFHPRDG